MKKLFNQPKQETPLPNPDDVLRRMLNAPPNPHKPLPTKSVLKKENKPTK